MKLLNLIFGKKKDNVHNSIEKDILSKWAKGSAITPGIVQFQGYCGNKAICAAFKIGKGLPKGATLTNIIVSHEGRWICEESMFCHPDYKFYEDVQKDLGNGLIFIRKEYSEIMNRSLFTYSVDNASEGNCTLAVPATGEEICFEIFGVTKQGGLILLEKREL